MQLPVIEGDIVHRTHSTARKVTTLSAGLLLGGVVITATAAPASSHE